MLEEAKKKINEEDMKSPYREALEKIRLIVDGWLDYDTSAAELVMDKDKTIHGAYMAMREAARDKAKNSEYCMDSEEALYCILEYFGLTHERALGLIEGGFMFYLMQKFSETWKPYETKAPKPQTSAPASAGLDVSLEDLL